jgi:two-component system chemotaxis sensor kinase CheA
MSPYHDLFISETREHLQQLSVLTIALEADHEDKATIDALFRSVHSVKGMAASMGFDAATEVAHKLEDLMDSVRKGFEFDAELFDLLLAGESTLSKIVDDIANGGGGNLDTDDILDRISAYQTKTSAGNASQEMIESTQEEQSAPASREDQFHQQTVKIKTAVLDRFLNTTGELITVKHRLSLIARNSRNHDFSDALLSLDKHLRDLHDQVMGIRLMPLSVITERFPRMIRDIARSSGKEITFSIKGAEIELDRSILDLIGDPLSHLLRNSVDHGIETPQERVANGKPASGRISISVSREKDQVEIRIEDDGRGMNHDKIVAAAVAKGFISKDKAAVLSDDEKLLLICHPGFSTAEKITDISGRGVGMDVVRTAIQSMGGALSIITESGAGSYFLLRLPLTIAIINVLLVKVGSITLAFPLTAVDRTMELKCDELATVEEQRIFFLNDDALPITSLAQFLNINSLAQQRETVQLFITEIKGQKMAFEVDQLLGNQEIFVRPLPRPLSALQGINGATVLGSGEVVFILDILTRF